MWAGLQAACVKITISGINNLLNSCVIFMALYIFAVHLKMWPWATWYNVLGCNWPAGRGLDIHSLLRYNALPILHSVEFLRNKHSIHIFTHSVKNNSILI